MHPPQQPIETIGGDRRESTKTAPSAIVSPSDHDALIDRGLIFFIVVLVPSIPFTAFRLPTGTYFLPFIAIPVAALGYWSLITFKFALPPPRAVRQVTLIIITLFAWVVLSMIWSQTPQVSRVGSLAFYIGAVTFTLIFQRTSSDTLFRASSLLLTLMTLLTLYGLYLFASGQDHWFQFTSETASAVGTRNADAFMVATAFPLALSRTIVSGIRLPAKVLAGGAGAVCVAAVLLSLSRSATVGLVLATLIILGFGSRLIPVRPRTIAIVAVLSIVTFLLLKTYFSTSELSFTRFGTLNQSSRIPLAQTAFDTGRAHPFTGVGYFEFTTLNSYGEDAHDAYLNLFAELGIPGVTLFALMLLAPLISYVRLARLPHWGSWLPAKTRILYIQGFGMLLTLTLLAATDTFYKSIYFWIVYMLSIMHLASAQIDAKRLFREE